MRQYNYWTAEEDKLIAELIEQGDNPAECADLLAKHTVAAIKWHTAQLRKGERPHFHPTLLARHSNKAVYLQSTKLRKNGLSYEPVKASAPKPTHSIILSSMVSPLQRKAIIGTMFN